MLDISIKTLTERLIYVEKEFWKTSASSLREKAVPQQPEKQTAQKNWKKQKNKEHSFHAIRQLENAYGKYVFGANDDRYVVKVSRKSEYRETTFDQSREELNENRLFEKKTSGARLFTDSHKKEESAVIYEETVGNISAERMFKGLKAAVQKENKLTLKEMMPERAEIEKKVFQNLKASVEALKKENTTSETLPFLRRIMNPFVPEDMVPEDDDQDNTYS